MKPNFPTQMKPKFIVLVDPLAPKVTIRKNGNLWFNLACNEIIKFDGTNNRFRFADDEENKDVFYMVATAETENTLKAVRNGKYYNIGSKVLVKKLGAEEGWHYLLTKDTWNEKPIFVFTRIEKEETPAAATEETQTNTAAPAEQPGQQPATDIPYREEWKVVNQE